MAGAAVEVVNSGALRFTPENNAAIYLQWMENLHDWCISRQLWWGHRIPAWHCGNCHKITVAREAPDDVHALREREPGAGSGRARHVVLLGAAAVHLAGLAGGDA